MSKKKYTKCWDQYSFFTKLWYRIVYLFSKKRVPKPARKYLSEQYGKIKSRILKFFGLATEKTKPVINRVVKTENISDSLNISKYGAPNVLKNLVAIGAKSISDEKAYRNSINNAVDIIEMTDAPEKKEVINDIAAEIAESDSFKKESDVKSDIIEALSRKSEQQNIYQAKKKKKKHHSETDKQNDARAIHIKLNLGSGDASASFGSADSAATIIDSIKKIYTNVVSNRTDDCNNDTNKNLEDCLRKAIQPDLEIDNGLVVMHRIRKNSKLAVC